MKQEEFENKFLDFLEGSLPDSEARAFNQELSNNPELQKSLDEYIALTKIEADITSGEQTLPASFSVKVMEDIENLPSGFFSTVVFRRLNVMNWFTANKRIIFQATGTLATVVLLITVVTRHTGQEAQMAYSNVGYSIAGGRANPQLSPSESVVATNKAVESKEDDGQFQVAVLDKLKTSPRLEFENQRKEGITHSAPTVVTPVPTKVAPETKEGITSFGFDGVSTLYSGIERSDMNDVLDAKPRNIYSNLEKRKSPKTFARPVEVDKFEETQAQGAVSSHYDRIVIYPPVPPQSNEEYSQYTENPRILVTSDPISTFGMDVDTASYANIRRFLSAGQRPPRNAVRIEELINYFRYNYPMQTKEPFTVSYEIAPSPLEQNRYLLKLGVKARDMENSDSRKPWNLVFLIDTSGSMADSNKLPLVKSAIKLLVEHMQTNDRIAIVTYGDYSQVTLSPMGVGRKSEILSVIDRLSASGGTNGAAGLELAYTTAAQSFIPNGINRVILATDGDFNVGMTKLTDLISFVEQKRQNGVMLTALGFGTGNLKDQTIETLANKGNGHYHYIDNFSEARKVLETDIIGTIETVAKDFKIQIEFNPKHVVEYRLIGYENRVMSRQDFHNDAVDSGEIGSGHTVTALYELVLANSEFANQVQGNYRYQQAKKSEAVELKPDLVGEIAFVKIRFKEPNTNQSTLREYPLMSTEIKKDVSTTSDDFRFTAAVSYFGHLLRNSQFVGSYTFDDIVKLAEGSRGVDQSGQRQEFIELVKNARALRR